LVAAVLFEVGKLLAILTLNLVRVAVWALAWCYLLAKLGYLLLTGQRSVTALREALPH
jgi:hypothetical protein